MSSTMPKYAVLGATGSTGTQLTKTLFNRSDIHLHIYARSASKVSRTFPELADAKNVTTFVGALSETEKFASCLEGTTAIFSVVAQNFNEPGCSVTQDAAQAIVHALETVRNRARHAGESWTPPKLVLLASASVAPIEQEPNWVARKIAENASWYVYEDLRLGIAYLQAEAPWLPLVVAAPPAIVECEAQGFEIGLALDSTTVSYADLAGAMIQMAEQDGWEGQYVAIKGLGPTHVALLMKSLFRYLLPGMVTTWLPWMFGPLKSVGFF